MIIKFQAEAVGGEITTDADAIARDQVEAFTAALIAEGYCISTIVDAYKYEVKQIIDADGHMSDD